MQTKETTTMTTTTTSFEDSCRLDVCFLTAVSSMIEVMGKTSKS